MHRVGVAECAEIFHAVEGILRTRLTPRRPARPRPSRGLACVPPRHADEKYRGGRAPRSAGRATLQSLQGPARRVASLPSITMAPTAHAAGLGWLVVGASVLLLRAHVSSRRKKASDQKLSKAVGNGRRSRFQDAQIPPIYCVPDARVYEQAATRLEITGESVVLEIGCQLNSVTKKLAERAKRVIGVDIYRKAPTSQRRAVKSFYRHPDTAVPANATLHVCDVWDLNELNVIMRAAGKDDNDVTIALIDASVVLGNDLPFEILALARSVCRLCRNLQCLVVKSRALCLLQHQLRPAPCPSRPITRPAQSDVIAAGVHLVAADLVHDYRNAALACVTQLLLPGECALEIGAHIGATTVLIHDALVANGGGACVGVDVSDAIIGRAKKLHKHVPFDVADAWDVQSLRAALERAANGARAAGITAAREGKSTSLRAPALLLVDVGGLSGANGTLDALALIRMLCAVFHASLRALVIKSSCMRTLARQLRQLRDLGNR